jgi:hypothetical protein
MVTIYVGKWGGNWRSIQGDEAVSKQSSVEKDEQDNINRRGRREGTSAAEEIRVRQEAKYECGWVTLGHVIWVSILIHLYDHVHIYKWRVFVHKRVSKNKNNNSIIAYPAIFFFPTSRLSGLQ